MRRERGPAGGVVVLLSACTCAFALNPALDVSQYAHTAWKIRDGFTKGVTYSIAQTPDGYLWLATEFGLVRFDGVNWVSWQPPVDQHLPSSTITSVLGARDGTLWIGTMKGLASWKDGKLTQYPQLAGQPVNKLVEDREGAVWAGGLAFSSPGKLCSIRNGSVQCYGENGELGFGVLGLYEDSRGNLWVGIGSGVWRWKPGPPKFFSLPGYPNGIQGLVDDHDGALLITTPGGVRRLVAGRAEMAYPFPPPLQRFQAHRMLRDRDGVLWIGTSGQGLVHEHQGRTDVFTHSDGLSGDGVYAMFEDRERNIWVATASGLDRFRDLAATTFSVNQGLSNAIVTSVLAGTDGSLWVGTFDGLDRRNHGQLSVYRERPGHAQPGVREITGRGLPENGVQAIFQDDRGRIWISTRRGVGYLENERFVPLGGVPGGNTSSIAGDTVGGLWIANTGRGLFHVLPEDAVQEIPLAKLNRKDQAVSLLADSRKGGVWTGFFLGGLFYLGDGQVQASYAAADGLGEGRVGDLRLDRDGALWAATAGGLSRVKDGRIATLTSRSGLPCDGVHWLMEDDAHAFWLDMACGLVRVDRPELDAWTADPRHAIKATVFDDYDGVRSTAIGAGYSPHAAKTPDGRLWFATSDGLGVIDPRHLPFNKLAPPVHIETVKVNGKEVAAAEGMALSHRNNDLEIDYTALSLTIPERVRFRYKLEGKDKDWLDAGTRRQAFYGGLAPKNYRFRVMACNNDGVWNEAGATWNFRIVPAYYQTPWFQAFCVLAVAAVTWMLYSLRLRQMTAKVNLLYTERLAERTRIARDLHDTLLQSLAGVSLQLHGISKQAVTAPEKIPALIDRVRQQVDSAFREARMKVYNMRSPTLEGQGLAAALNEFTERIGPDVTARCSFTVTGDPRDCTPEVEEQLLRIAQEAANNANRHAQAGEIRIALDYGAKWLTLSVSDDGRGFDLEEGYRKSDHWGLKNMQERAAQIRGTCKITTAPGKGTRLGVRVPLSAWSLRNTRAKHADSSTGS